MVTVMPRLHFAMLTYGALDETKRAVRSLVSNTPQGFQLNVVDNASADATPEWLEQQNKPWLRYKVNASNRGVPGGRNDLMDFILPTTADTDWIVFIDNDLEFQEGWVQPFLEAIERFPDARVLGKVGHFLTVTEEGRALAPAPSHTAEVDVVSGGFACFVRADAARVIGKFDEQLGQFWHEDDDYCVRAVQHGYTVVAVPEANIVHHEHASGVATPDLEDGGSLTNLRYLANKWRDAGYVDSGGWIKRSNGPYMLPEIRLVLEQRSARTTTIGRAEIAASIALLGQMLEQPNALDWFDKNRQPIPACTWPLLALHREHATTTGDSNLANKFAQIEAFLQQACNTRLLAPMQRGVAVHQMLADKGYPAPGQGVCRDDDFDTPEFTQAAQDLGLDELAADPHTRTIGLWELLAITTQLRRARIVRPTARALIIGEELQRVPGWLRANGVACDYAEQPDQAQGHYDAIIFVKASGDAIKKALASHAKPDATVILNGVCSLNGVPTRDAPQSQQIAFELDRFGLAPNYDIALTADTGALEACLVTDDFDQTPQLCRLSGPQLLTSHVIAAHQVGAPSHSGTVITPARANTEATLRVGVDLRTLGYEDSTARGIGKFTTQHLLALCDADPGLRIIGYTQNDGCVLPKALQRPQITAMSIDDYSPEQVDVVHIPDPMNMSLGFDSPTRVLRHKNATVTFHDLTPLHCYLDQWPEANRQAYHDRLQQLERSNCHLLTNSQFTATDTMAHTSIPEERVTPILAGLHHDGGQPPSPEVVADVHRQLGIKGPFVLHVGALDPHKNFYASLNAFLMARSQQPLQLVVVGAIDPGMTQAAAFINKKNVPDVLFTGYLPRKHLDALYASATALLFLSKAEGFGLPILEAMAKGCPVIASNATSHPEVAGNAALLIDPEDQTGAAHHLQQLLTDNTLAMELRQRGMRQAKRFTWQATAERTLAVWQTMTAKAPSPVTPTCVV